MYEKYTRRKILKIIYKEINKELKNLNKNEFLIININNNKKGFHINKENKKDKYFNFMMSRKIREDEMEVKKMTEKNLNF